MARSGKFAATIVGVFFFLAAVGARGQQTAAAAADTRPEASTTPGLTAKRIPADMPPNPPKVTCDGGQLTISAQNSTLGAVLNAIRGCTGAEIDVPADASAERLFAELGPGPLRAVLAELLNSTDFNYVIKASPADPQKVQMVLLNPRPADSTSATEVAEVVDTGANMTANRRGWMKARENYMQTFTAANEEAPPPPDTASSASPASPPVEAPAASAAPAPADTTASSAEPVPAAADPAVPSSSLPVVSSPAANPIASAPSGSDAGMNQSKSTQELITDMQRMFEQRKQMVQQQQQQTTTPPHP